MLKNTQKSFKLKIHLIDLNKMSSCIILTINFCTHSLYGLEMVKMYDFSSLDIFSDIDREEYFEFLISMFAI